jgi:hypothetical protein
MLDITNQILDMIRKGKRLSANEVVLIVKDYNHYNSTRRPAIAPDKVLDELFDLITEEKIYLTSDKTRLGFVFTY